MSENQGEDSFYREYWVGDSRDGVHVNADGYHYYKFDVKGFIEEAYEYYELDSGEEVVVPIPEMRHVNWLKDLGFEDYETLEKVEEREFKKILSIRLKNIKS